MTVRNISFAFCIMISLSLSAQSVDYKSKELNESLTYVASLMKSSKTDRVAISSVSITKKEHVVSANQYPEGVGLDSDYVKVSLPDNTPLPIRKILLGPGNFNIVTAASIIEKNVDSIKADFDVINSKFAQMTKKENLNGFNNPRSLDYQYKQSYQSVVESCRDAVSRLGTTSIDEKIDELYYGVVNNELRHILNPVETKSQVEEFLKLTLNTTDIDSLGKYFNPDYISNETFDSLTDAVKQRLYCSVQDELRHVIDAGLDLDKVVSNIDSQVNYNVLIENFTANTESIFEASKEIAEVRFQFIKSELAFHKMIVDSVNSIDFQSTSSLAKKILKSKSVENEELKDGLTFVTKTMDDLNDIQEFVEKDFKDLQNLQFKNMKDNIATFSSSLQTLSNISSSLGLDLGKDFNEFSEEMELAGSLATGNYMGAVSFVSGKLFGTKKSKKNTFNDYLAKSLNAINKKLDNIQEGIADIKDNQKKIIEHQKKIYKAIKDVEFKVDSLIRINRENFNVIKTAIEDLNKDVCINRELIQEVALDDILSSSDIRRGFISSPDKFRDLGASRELVVDAFKAINKRLPYHPKENELRIKRWFLLEKSSDCNKGYAKDILVPMHNYYENELISKNVNFFKVNRYVHQGSGINKQIEGDILNRKSILFKKYFDKPINAIQLTRVYNEILSFLPMLYYYDPNGFTPIEPSDTTKEIGKIYEYWSKEIRDLLNNMIDISDIAIAQENLKSGGPVLKMLWEDLAQGNQEAINFVKNNEVLKSNVMMYALREIYNVPNFDYSLTHFGTKDVSKIQKHDRKDKFEVKSDSNKLKILYKGISFPLVMPDYYRVGRLTQSHTLHSLVSLKDDLIRFKADYLFQDDENLKLSTKELESLDAMIVSDY